MKRSELQEYIFDNGLLEDCKESSGIYTITIDRGVVYVGQSKNIYQRCSQHIYNIQNAILNKEKKYELLLAAQLGGHIVDCYYIEYCPQSELDEKESYWIGKLKPCLNILTPEGKQDINNLKIEDVLEKIRFYIH